MPLSLWRSPCDAHHLEQEVTLAFVLSLSQEQKSKNLGSVLLPCPQFYCPAHIDLYHVLNPSQFSCRDSRGHEVKLLIYIYIFSYTQLQWNSSFLAVSNHIALPALLSFLMKFYSLHTSALARTHTQGFTADCKFLVQFDSRKCLMNECGCFW